MIRALALLLPLALAGPATATSLFGVTRSDAAGDVDFVGVNTGSGAATTLFTFNVGAGNSSGTLAYHRPSGRFLIPFGSTADGILDTLGILDPGSQSFSSVAITGLSGTAPDASGIVYDRLGDRILISFADDGSTAEDNVAEIGLDGIAVASVSSLVPDIDALGFRGGSDEIVGWDPNNAGAQRIFRIEGLFAAPSTTNIGSTPSNNDVGDISIDPLTGVIYTVFFDSAGGRLQRVDGDATYVDIGAFGASRQLSGIAFVPEPGVGLLLAAAVALGAACRSGRRAARQPPRAQA